MENNFNNDLSQKVFQKLEKKIAIEEFKVKEKCTKSYTGIKVASILLIAGMIAGNMFTYARYNENIFSWALNKIGILQDYTEEKTELNIVQENKNATLTLTDYGVDKNTLIVGYSLKLNEKQEFEERLYDNTKIYNDAEVYGVEDKNTEFFTKISDTEYMIYELYTIDGKQLTGDVRFETNIKLYEKITNPDLIPEIIGEWNFDINLDKKKFEMDYEEYAIEDKSAKLEIINSEIKEYPWKIEAHIVGLKRSKLTTKLVVLLEGYTTEPDIRYFVEVLDENGMPILENHTTYTIGGVPTDIIFKSLPENSKITVNVYESLVSSNKDIRKGSVVIDFSKDLKEKEKRNINKVKKQWRDIEFEYNKDNEIDISRAEQVREGGPKEHFSVNMEIGEKIRNTISYYGFLQMSSYKNVLNLSLEEIYKAREKIEYYSGGILIGENYNLYVRIEKDSAPYNTTINHSEMMKFLSGEDITVPVYVYDNNENEVQLGNKTFSVNDNLDNQKIKFNNKENIKIDGVDVITYTTTTSETYRHYIFVHNGYIYEMNHTSNFEVRKEMEDIINSIRFIK